MSLFISVISALLRITAKVFFAVLPSVLVFSVLMQPQILMNRGVPVIGKTDHAQIHELFPNSSWNDLEPCGKYFDETEEFRKARSCVNDNVWPDTPLDTNELEYPIPRCFIVKAQGPNIISKEGINFIPVFDPLMGVGAVVGVYQPETRTVYVVENVDAPMIYRHELQHYFLHEHDPETTGGGHHQPIWQKCEPPFYDPSARTKALAPETEEGSEDSRAE